MDSSDRTYYIANLETKDTFPGAHCCACGKPPIEGKIIILLFLKKFIYNFEYLIKYNGQFHLLLSKDIEYQCCDEITINSNGPIALTPRAMYFGEYKLMPQNGGNVVYRSLMECTTILKLKCMG